MSVISKLNREQYERISSQLEELQQLHQESIEKDVTGFIADWETLHRTLHQAILEYRHIHITDECFTQ